MLEAEGWHKEQGPRGKSLQTYYLPPGVMRGPGFKNRVDYFDSRTLVLRHLSKAIEQGANTADAATAKAAYEVDWCEIDSDHDGRQGADSADAATAKAAYEVDRCEIDSDQDDRQGSLSETLPVVELRQPAQAEAITLDLTDDAAIDSSVCCMPNMPCDHLSCPSSQRVAKEGPELACSVDLTASSLDEIPTPSRVPELPARSPTQDEAAIAKVMSLRALIEISTSSSPEKEVLATLRRLEALGPFSLETLRTTLVGKAVNSLQKRTSSVTVRAYARTLLKSWKGAVSHGSPAPPQAAMAPPGVDPEIWPQIPAECRTWAVSASPSTPARSLSHAVQSTSSQKQNSIPRRIAHDQRTEAKRRRLTLAHRSHRSSQVEHRSKRPKEAVHLSEPKKSVELQSDSCVVCLSRPKSHAFVPCGHECVCGQCSEALIRSGAGKCPICRTDVAMAMKIFR
jgi:hypothetical protein